MSLKKPGSKPHDPDRHAVWDEDNLAYNEANKTATMKIDEPKTPWASPLREPIDDDGDDIPPLDLDGDADQNEAGPSSSGEEAPTGGVTANALLAGLQEASTSRPAPRANLFGGPAPGDDDEGDCDAGNRPRDPAKAKKFAAQRKAHYNEFEMMQRAKAMMAEDDDDDER